MEIGTVTHTQEEQEVETSDLAALAGAEIGIGGSLVR